MFARRAEPEDCRAVFELSNDPLVRAVSFSSEPIPYDTHVKWFASRLRDPDCLFLLFFEGNELAAQVRFTRNPVEGLAEVSISVSPAYRGRGMALEMMKEAETLLPKSWTVRGIKALVKVDNEASNRFFVKAGYAFVERITYRGYDTNVYIFRPA